MVSKKKLQSIRRTRKKNARREAKRKKKEGRNRS